MLDLQKAGIMKRISAFLLDIILLAVITAGFAFLLSAVTDFDAKTDTMKAFYAAYSAEYGTDLTMTQTEYEALSTEEKEKCDAAFTAMNADEEAVYTYSLVVNLALLITTLSILCGYLVLEFAVPLIFKNGQTIGKKVFGIGIMRTDGIKISTLQLFIRTVLGKYTVETMVPVLTVLLILFFNIGFFGTVLILLLFILELGILIGTKTNSLIHDLLAETVAVDIASQMIFENEEALIAFKKKIHKAEVQTRPY